MRFFKYILLFTIIFTSCKTTKNMIDANATAKEISARKVAKKHIAANFDKKTIDAKLKVNFDNGKTKQSLTVSMKMKKDESLLGPGWEQRGMLQNEKMNLVLGATVERLLEPLTLLAAFKELGAQQPWTAAVSASCHVSTPHVVDLPHGVL